MGDILDGVFFDIQELERAIAKVKKQNKYDPTILVTSQQLFDRMTLGAVAPPVAFSLKQIGRLGIRRIIWAEYLTDDEFELTSERAYQALQYRVETLNLGIDNAEISSGTSPSTHTKV